MSIEAKMEAVIKSRQNNFYDLFDEFKTEDKYYYADPGDPDFDFMPEFDEDGNPNAQTEDDILKEKIYKTRMAKFKALSVTIDSNASIYYTDDESSEFFGYSYDEIIGMANNGTTIPDEILEWAYAMADANATETTEETEGNDAHALYLSLKNNPFLNIKTITKIFVNKCDEQTEALEAYLDEIDPIEREMEAANVEAETNKEQSLNNIKSLVKEWKDLQAKVDNGEELSTNEQERFAELNGLFNEEDAKYQDNVDDTTRNFNKFGERLNFVSQKADTTIDFGAETILISNELAEFEKTNKNRSVFGGLIAQGFVGLLGANSLAGNKKFSQVAHTIGVNTQNFATDVNTTIKEVQALMQNTADTAGFEIEDQTHTVESLASSEGVTEPTVATKSKTTTPTPQEGTEPATTETADTTSTETTDGEGVTETEQEEDQNAENQSEPLTDEEQIAQGENTLEDVNAKSLSMPKLKQLIQKEGEDSEKKGQDALKLVEQLKTQSTIVDEKEKQVEEDTTNLQETAEESPTETDTNTPTGETESSEGNGGAMEEAEVTATQSQEELTAATQDEALTVESLRQTFDASTKANKKYTKDVNIANDKMKDNIATGAFTIAGGYMTGVGIYNVVQGTALLSAAGWWNPFIAALAAFMIDKGTIEIALGGTMIAGGTALTVSAAEGLEINDQTAEKIGISSENITSASENLDEFERQQTGEVEGQEGSENAEGAEEGENAEEPTEDDLRAQDEKTLEQIDLSNLELPELKSLVHSEGKTSATLGKENVKMTKELEPQIPAITEEAIELARAKRDQEAAQAAQANNSDNTSETEQVSQDIVENTEQLEQEDEEKKNIFQQYREDFQQDKATNKQHSNDIKYTAGEAAKGMGLGLLGTTAGGARTAFGATEIATGTILAMQWWNPMAMMLGLFLIKQGSEDTALGLEMIGSGMALTVSATATLATSAVAGARVGESNDQTDESMAKVDTMETEVNTAVEEQLAKDEEEAEKAQETEEPEVSIEQGAENEAAETNPTENPDDAEANAADMEKDSAQAVKDDEQNAQKDESKAKKQKQKEKTADKSNKKYTKEIKIIKKNATEAEKEAEEQGKEAEIQIAEGETTASEANEDEVQENATQAETEGAEAEGLATETEELVSETVDIIEETKANVATATTENQTIVTEMNTLNSGLQQDENKIKNLKNKLKQEEQKSSQPQPAQQPSGQEPQQTQAPTPVQKAKVADKPAEETNEPSQEENQTPAPTQSRAATQQEQEKPEGFDKTEFASDKNKQPDFVGFVAQSDSLASGNVLAPKTKQKTTSNTPNSIKQGGGLTALKNAANKKKAQNKAKATAQKQSAQESAQQQQLIQKSQRTTQKPFDINSMSGGNGNNQTQQIKTSMQALSAAAFHKQARLSAMAVRANNNVMANIQKEAYAQAEAAKNERLAQEKQERIAKIKQFAGYVQGVGALTTTAGMIVSKVGTGTIAAGTAQVSSGTALAAEGTAAISAAGGLMSLGSTQITIGGTQITIGSTMVGTGTVSVTTGTAAEASGITTQSIGAALQATGYAMMSNPFTAAAGAAMVGSGIATTASGTAVTGSGIALMTSGITQVSTGTAQIGTGTATTATGTATVATGTATAAEGGTALAAGITQIALGSAQIGSGTALVATGGTIQAIGAYTSAAGAAVSAGADIANGNILGGIATIVGAAASVVGVNTNMSTLGQAATQLGSQGAALAGQLATAGAGQENSNQDNKKQGDKQKQEKIKNDKKTQNVLAKNQKRMVQNRFNK